jgi:hypothetical protein
MLAAGTLVYSSTLCDAHQACRSLRASRTSCRLDALPAACLQVTAPDSMPLAFPKDEASEQLLSDSYKLKGMLQQRELPLEDAAAEAARQGSCDSSSPWLQAFDSVRRFAVSVLSRHRVMGVMLRWHCKEPFAQLILAALMLRASTWQAWLFRLHMTSNRIHDLWIRARSTGKCGGKSSGSHLVVCAAALQICRSAHCRGSPAPWPACTQKVSSRACCCSLHMCAFAMAALVVGLQSSEHPYFCAAFNAVKRPPHLQLHRG